MARAKSHSFTAEIGIIGINPYVLLPEPVLEALFADAGKRTGAIPIKGTINGHPFLQNLVKYSGAWRLYLNMPMRKGGHCDVGDTAKFSIAYDPEERETPMPELLARALQKHREAKKVFDRLPASRQKEVKRYINNLKSPESVQRNVERAIQFLLGKERFIGRDQPE